MELVQEGDHWKIAGPEEQRARVAYAILDGDHVRYELAPGLGAESETRVA